MNSRGNPKVLFDTISDIVPPAPPLLQMKITKIFLLSWLKKKIPNVRSAISPSASTLSFPATARPHSLVRFSSVSFPKLVKLVDSMNASFCSFNNYVLRDSALKGQLERILLCPCTTTSHRLHHRLAGLSPLVCPMGVAI